MGARMTKPLSLPVLDGPGADRDRGDLLHEKCGVVGIWGAHQPAHHAYVALFALQHRGQESAGIAATGGHMIERHTGMGLVGRVFHEPELDALDALAEGRAGGVGAGAGGHGGGGPGGVIGHNRYSTTGASRPENAQPFVGTYRAGAVAIAHNGNLVNASEIRARLENEGRAFHTTTDTEVVLSLLASHSQGTAHEDPLGEALRELRGAFSLVLLFEDRVEAARDPWGWRPLVLGRMPDEAGGGYVVASETVALAVLDAEYIREVEPGEIVTLSDEGVASRRFAAPATPLAHCVFEHVYFASPASELFGSTVQIVRERLGARLAEEAGAEADLVIPMPDSGRSAATGFARAAGLPYHEAIIPNRYVGRTFIKPTGAERAAAVRLKLNIISEMVDGRRCVIVDDSIVRGTTTRAKMDQLRHAGAKEIHLRISCPPIRHPCFFGVDFPERSQLIAATHDVEGIRAMLGVDSLAFLSIEGLLEVVGTRREPAENYCTACYSGRYPIEVNGSATKDMLGQKC